jgi:hypothetical protein
MSLWMDKVGEFAPGLTGFSEETETGFHVVAITSSEPGKGHFSDFLDSLPDDKSVTFHDVTSIVVRDALFRRGFRLEHGFSLYLNKNCDNFVRDDLPPVESLEPFRAEVRFDSYTFRDLPELDRSALLNILDASPIVISARINDKPRDQELDEQYLAENGRPRPKGGLHGGLGEGVYLYIAGVAIVASKKVVERIVEELTKRIFDWLDERYRRRKEIGLAEVTLYGPDGQQINRRAIVYDGRLRKPKSKP